ncbi:MAG: hypothetical protein QNJ11_08165 [Woeseiaceae bacterium]|nr:hypothetical protein [Woeseiaceae bacterium]
MPATERDVAPIVVEIEAGDDWSGFLRRQYATILASGAANRPWLFWELHNPWSRVAAMIDSWQVLDICQSGTIVDAVTKVIGDDVVLFDSQALPNPGLDAFDDVAWQHDDTFFPIDEPTGVVVRIPFGIEYGRDEGAAPVHQELVVRYFSASSLYLRDPQHPKQQRLMELYPWINYTTLPLWLVSGEDRAGNDFVTGFATKPGRWTRARSG